MTSTQALKLPQKIAYGIGDFAPALAVHSMNFYLLYYLTQVAKLGPAYAGLMLMLAKLWDAIIDPFVGACSDHTRSKLGKRRLYLLISSLPFGLCFALLWFPLSPNQAQLQIMLVLLLFSTALTFYNIPYSALAADMTQDYHERNSLMSYRMGFNMLGTLIGSGLTLMLVDWLGAGNQTQGYQLMGIIFGLLISLACLLCFCFTREQVYTEASHGNFRELLGDYRKLFDNHSFRPLLAMFCFNTLATTVLSAIMIYFINDVLKLEKSLAQLPMGLLLLSAMFSLPIWNLLSRRWDKKHCHAFGMAGLTSIVLLITYTAHWSLPWFFILIALAGFCLATTFIFNWSMLLDSMAVDRQLPAGRREGLYTALWFFGQKLSMAAALWLNGVMLDWARDESMIVLLTGPVPALFLLLSMGFLWRYPLTQQNYIKSLKTMT